MSEPSVTANGLIREPLNPNLFRANHPRVGPGHARPLCPKVQRGKNAAHMSGEPVGVSPASPPTHVPLPAEGPRRTVVLLLIVLTALIFVGLFAVLYYRWSGAEEPSSIIVVTPTAAFEGADITVEGTTLAKPYKVTIPSGNGRALPFYVEHGIYTVTLSRDGKTIYTYSNLALQRNRSLQIPLERIEHILPLPSTVNAGTSGRG